MKIYVRMFQLYLGTLCVMWLDSSEVPWWARACKSPNGFTLNLVRNVCARVAWRGC